MEEIGNRSKLPRAPSTGTHAAQPHFPCSFLALTLLVLSCAGIPDGAGTVTGGMDAELPAPGLPAPEIPQSIPLPVPVPPAVPETRPEPEPEALPLSLPEAPAEANRQSDWLKATLGHFATRPLPGGAELALLAVPGRKVASLVIAFEGGASIIRPGLEGIELLALALAAAGSASGGTGAFSRTLSASGARVGVKAISYDAVAMTASGPRDRFMAVMEGLAAALVHPAFLEPGFEAWLFEAIRSTQLRAVRRMESDPESSAAAGLLRAIAPDHPYARPPLGTGSSVAALVPEDVRAFWRDSMGAERLRIAVVGDFSVDGLAALFGPASAGLGRSAPSAPRPPPLPPSTPSIAALRDTDGTSLRGELPVPPRAHPDFPALMVALAAVEDSVNEELRGAGRSYTAWARVSWARAASASLGATGLANGAEGRAAFLRAASLVAAGRAVGGGSLESLIAGYRARTIARLYGRSSSTADLAERIARDLASGGDGSAWFRMADRLQAVRTVDVVRVARERLVEGPVAWIAAGPEAGMAGFAP